VLSNIIITGSIRLDYKEFRNKLFLKKVHILTRFTLAGGILLSLRIKAKYKAKTTVVKPVYLNVEAHLVGRE